MTLCLHQTQICLPGQVNSLVICGTQRGPVSLRVLWFSPVINMLHIHSYVVPGKGQLGPLEAAVPQRHAVTPP